MAQREKSQATEARAIREKREDYDIEEPVRQNVPKTVGVDTIVDRNGFDEDGEVKKGAKVIEVEQDGPVVTVKLGGVKVELDGEGVKGAARVFNALASGI